MYINTVDSIECECEKFYTTIKQLITNNLCICMCLRALHVCKRIWDELIEKKICKRLDTIWQKIYLNGKIHCSSLFNEPIYSMFILCFASVHFALILTILWLFKIEYFWHTARRENRKKNAQKINGKTNLQHIFSVSSSSTDLNWALYPVQMFGFFQHIVMLFPFFHSLCTLSICSHISTAIQNLTTIFQS